MTYWPGDKVRIQNILTKEFDLFGLVESQCIADYGKNHPTQEIFEAPRDVTCPEIPQNTECNDETNREGRFSWGSKAVQ